MIQTSKLFLYLLKTGNKENMAHVEMWNSYRNVPSVRNDRNISQMRNIFVP